MSNRPVRLAKQEESNFNRIYNLLYCRIERWVLAHLTLCITVGLIIAITLFVLVCYAIVGVSATDSGVTYNQFERII